METLHKTLTSLDTKFPSRWSRHVWGCSVSWWGQYSSLWVAIIGRLYLCSVAWCGMQAGDVGGLHMDVLRGGRDGRHQAGGLLGCKKSTEGNWTSHQIIHLRKGFTVTYWDQEIILQTTFFELIFLQKIWVILIQISLKFFPRNAINNKPHNGSDNGFEPHR